MAERVGRRAGRFLAKPRMWRSDIYRTKLEDITPSRPVDFTSEYNEDWDTKRRATFEVQYPDALKDLEDFIVLELDWRDSEGREETFNLGHFVVMGRAIETQMATRTGVLQGRDLTWLLQQMTMEEYHVVAAGSDPGDAARDLMIDRGIPAAMIDIPSAEVATTSDIVSMPGENWLTFLTAVLAAGGMYQPWLNYDNRIVSRKAWDVSRRRCTGNFQMSEGAKLIPPVSNEPDLSRFRNRVTVRKEVPGESLIEYTATVEDRSSPAHPETIQKRMGARQPIILGRTYEEPTLASVAEAKLLAEARLSESVSYLDRLRLETPPDRTLCGHRNAHVDVEWKGQRYHEGTWLQRTWGVRGRGARVTVRRELTQTVRWA